MKAVKRIVLMLVMALAVSVIPASVAKADSKPAATKSIEAVATELGVAVKWEPIINAEKYGLYRREHDGTSWGDWISVKTLKDVTYTDPTVEEGVKYQYRVRGYNSAGWGSYKASKEVVAAAITKKPSACKSITVTADFNQIKVSWSEVKGVLKYGLYRREFNDSEWSDWSRIGYYTKTNYTDTNVTGGVTYQYRVRANNAAGWSKYKVSDEIEVPVPKPDAPAAVKAKLSTDKINVTWSFVEGVEKYRLYRKVYDGTTWTGWTKIDDFTERSYSDKDLVAGRKYQYCVKSYNKGGWSDKTESEAVEVLMLKPVAPENVVAVLDSDNYAFVSWNAIDGCDKYRVTISEYNGDERVSRTEKTVKTTSLTYKSVKHGYSYVFTIEGHNAKGYGKKQDSNTLYVLYEKPAAPETVTAVLDDHTVTIEWSKTQRAKKYRVYRRTYEGTSWGSWEKILDTTSISAEDTVRGGQKYQYSVKGYNDAGWGERKNSNSVTVQLLKPKAPAKLEVKSVNNTVKLSWDEVVDFEKFEISRRKYDGKWSSWEKIGESTKLEYTDKSVEIGGIYTYRVRAYNASGYSAYVNSVSITVHAANLDAPKSISVKNQDGGIKISWSAVKGANRYCVKRMELIDAKWELYYADYKLTGTSLIDDMGLIEGRKYKYVVCSMDGVKEGDAIISEQIIYTESIFDKESGITSNSICKSEEEAEETFLYKAYGSAKNHLGFYVYYDNYSLVLMPEELTEQFPGLQFAENYEPSFTEYTDCIKVYYNVSGFKDAFRYYYIMKFRNTDILTTKEHNYLSFIDAISRKEKISELNDYEKIKKIQDILIKIALGKDLEGDYAILHHEEFFLDPNESNFSFFVPFMLFCYENEIEVNPVYYYKYITDKFPMWYQVKIDGEWYNLDLYDDYFSCRDGLPDQKYAFLLKSDEYFSAAWRHSMEGTTAYKCNSDKYDHVGLEPFICNSIEAAGNIVDSQVTGKTKNIYVVCPDNKVNYSDVVEYVKQKRAGKKDKITIAHSSGYSIIVIEVPSLY